MQSWIQNYLDAQRRTVEALPVDQIAEFLCRTEKEVRDQAKKLGLGELPTVKAARKRKLISGTRKPRPVS